MHTRPSIGKKENRKRNYFHVSEIKSKVHKRKKKKNGEKDSRVTTGRLKRGARVGILAERRFPSEKGSKEFLASRGGQVALIGEENRNNPEVGAARNRNRVTHSKVAVGTRAITYSPSAN